MKALCTILIMIQFILFSCNTKQNNNKWIPVPEKSPEVVGQKVMKELLDREKFMMYDTKNVTAVHYAEACAGYGAARLAALLDDSVILSGLSKRYMKVITDSIPNTANHVDANVYGILPLELYKHTQNNKFLKQGLGLARKQWEAPLPNGLTRQTRFWIDDVWMINSLQVQAFRITGENKYLERAALETAQYLKKLQQPNGLFYHGSEAPFYWGRGNGWVAAGLAELLTELDRNKSHYKEILTGYRKMMNTLVKYQAEDGMWRQLIDKKEAWKETSCTGMFGYAISTGVKEGLLPAKKFTPAYQKAWLALTDYINEEGKVDQVCIGTGQSQNIEYYLNRPKTTGDLHGQAPVLWFAYRLLENTDQ